MGQPVARVPTQGDGGVNGSPSAAFCRDPARLARRADGGRNRPAPLAPGSMVGELRRPRVPLRRHQARPPACPLDRRIRMRSPAGAARTVLAAASALRFVRKSGPWVWPGFRLCGRSAAAVSAGGRSEAPIAHLPGLPQGHGAHAWPATGTRSTCLACHRDTEYMEHTWSITKTWRKRTADEIAKLHPTWDIQGSRAAAACLTCRRLLCLCLKTPPH
jgi:hypothetical protein